MVSPVAGLMVGNVLPETLSTHLPPISMGCCGLTWGGFTARALGAVAVLICFLRRQRRGEDGPSVGPVRCGLWRGRNGKSSVLPLAAWRLPSRKRQRSILTGATAW